ncbi:cyclodeaminase [Pseudomonas sp. LPB0260]|uniref:cyclodeaminase n=1 Tax=Pseudomonas sp. LPB0260 TaxID=2614442 RepID=UPI0015C1D06C|nr:cyclodeaminase [Pseudomonas sp. LPB0260]QLC73227.1 cyclodeaminase [Pseudomonas sp. LPB0260]QLC76001.1 cyclodeaminase [Pseudomonas sp. LPB0260]
MKIYNRQQIAERVKLDPAALEAVEAGFAALGRDEVAMPPILSMNIAESNGEVDVKTAHIRGWPRFAVKISPGFFDNPKLGLPSLNGLMLLFSAKTGLVDAVLFDEGYLTDIRTALAGAIAAKHLAREDAQRVAVIGAGLQAELQVAALRLVRDIREVHVHARDRSKAEAYAARLREQYGLAVAVHDSAAAACAEADIVVTTTPAREPVLRWSDLPKGVHVTAMGSDNPHKNELEPTILASADVVVVDRLSQSRALGELHHAPALEREVFELGSLIAAGRKARSGAEQITVCDLTGTGVQDTAIANYAARLLEEA